MDMDLELFQRLSHIDGLVRRLSQAVDSGLPGAAALAQPCQELTRCFGHSKRLQLVRRDDSVLASDLAQLAELAQQARSLCDGGRVRGRTLDTALNELRQEALDLQRDLARQALQAGASKGR